ncbi:MAG: PAS domain-containing protein [Myxococcales bacterium]|nr:PAS domain-containing protein [Myxococcales bacterium]
MKDTKPTIAEVLSRLVDGAPVVSFAKDLEGRYLFISQAALRLFGVESAALVGKTDREFFGPEAADRFLREDAIVIAERRPVEVLEKVPVGGKERTSWTTKFPLLDERGEPFGVGAISLDVTDREEARQRLEQSEERLRSVVDFTPAAYLLLDPELGHFVDANAAAAALFECSRDELLTFDPLSVSPPLQADGRPTKEVALDHIAAAMRGERRDFAWTHQTVTGRPFPCRVWLDRLDRDGRSAVRAFIIDERALAEARSEALRQRQITEQTQRLARVGGWALEFATGAIDATPQVHALLGSAVPISTLEQAAAHLTPASRETLTRGLEAAQRGESFDFELELSGDDVAPGMRWVRLVGDVQLEGERPVRLVGWLQDISARRELEERLRHASKMDAVGQLAGGVAHDFNNMLGAILNSTALLRHQVAALTPDIDESLKTIELAAGQAANLTRALLIFSRKEPVRRVPVRLDSVVRDAVAILEHTIDRRIVIERLGPAEPVTVEADPSQLKNVLINLGINARDAMPDGGRLLVATHLVELSAEGARRIDAELRAGWWVRLDVSDTGVGMPAEVLAHVFEPFFTTKEVGKGTGLGLATVYATVREHDGVVKVESEVGRGTTFSVWLPRSGASEQVTMETTKPSAPATGRVLLVDDEPLMRRATGRLLEALGFEVRLAEDGTDAEAMLKGWLEADVVLLDLMMPGPSPEETFAALRRVKPGVPIVLCSGYAPEDVAARLLSEPKVTHLQKPFNRAQLAEAIALVRR